MHEGLSPVAQDLINRMLVVDPEKRITIQQIFKHPFFNGQTNRLFINPPPPSLEELSLPIGQSERIERAYLDNLVLLFHKSPVEIEHALRTMEPSWEKAFLYLLRQYAERVRENYGEDGEDEEPVRSEPPMGVFADVTNSAVARRRKDMFAKPRPPLAGGVRMERSDRPRPVSLGRWDEVKTPRDEVVRKGSYDEAARKGRDEVARRVSRDEAVDMRGSRYESSSRYSREEPSSRISREEPTSSRHSREETSTSRHSHEESSRRPRPPSVIGPRPNPPAPPKIRTAPVSPSKISATRPAPEPRPSPRPAARPTSEATKVSRAPSDTGKPRPTSYLNPMAQEFESVFQDVVLGPEPFKSVLSPDVDGGFAVGRRHWSGECEDQTESRASGDYAQSSRMSEDRGASSGISEDRNRDVARRSTLSPHAEPFILGSLGQPAVRPTRRGKPAPLSLNNPNWQAVSSVSHPGTPVIDSPKIGQQPKVTGWFTNLFTFKPV
ncbi:hypothetical protein FRC11_001059, partial [Ceratobasidium sp. 423]